MTKINVLKNSGIEFSLSGKNYHEAEYQIEIKKHNKVHYYDLIPEEEVYTVHESDLRMDVENKKYIVREARPPFSVYNAFPDENLRTHIITRCGEEFGVTAEDITKEHLAQLKWIGGVGPMGWGTVSALNTDITTWEGLQYLTGLEYMTVYKNKNITSLRDLVIPASVTNVEWAFAECPKLERIPKNLFKKCKKLESVDHTFFESGIVSIPDEIFADLPKLTMVDMVFAGNLKLRSTPAYMFKNCTSLTDMDGVFYRADIHEIHPDTFRGVPSIVNATYLFWANPNLTKVPDSLFSEWVNVESLEACFTGCSLIQDVGVGLLQNCVNLKSISRLFDSSYYLRVVDENDNITLRLLEPGHELKNTINVYRAFGATKSTGGDIVTNLSSEEISNYVMGGASTSGKAVYCRPLTMSYFFNDRVFRDHIIERCMQEFGVSSSDDITKVHLSQLKWIGRAPYENNKVSAIAEARYFSGIELMTGLEYFTVHGSTIITETPLYLPLSLTSIDRMFYNCTNLTSVSQGTFLGMKNIKSAREVFAGCTGLEVVAGDLFKSSPDIEDISSMFNGCTKLRLIPENLFTDMYKVTMGDYLFQGCTSLIEIPKKLFRGLPNMLYMSGAFKECTSLTSIPENLFYGMTKNEYLDMMFEGCASLVNIPGGVFKGVSPQFYVQYAFKDCTSLTTIPEDLFDGLEFFHGYKGNLDRTFEGCVSLTSIPAGLFKYVNDVWSIKSMFLNCTSLTHVPSGLLNNLPNLEEIENMFQGNTSLVLDDNFRLMTTPHLSSNTIRVTSTFDGVRLQSSTPIDEFMSKCFGGARLYGDSKLVAI
ncbi:MAG: leucine-rich repeat protein [Paraclostridium sp.]